MASAALALARRRPIRRVAFHAIVQRNTSIRDAVPHRTRTDVWLLASLAVAAGVLALSYWRLYYGVDFTDEAYYMAVPLRFAQGARPFIDETTPAQQTAALLLYPIVATYDAVVGVEGIILFGRHLSFLFSCGLASCVYVGIRPFARTSAEAVIPSLVPVAFVPFSLPDPSYNTLGSGFLVAGIFLGLRFVATRQKAFVAAAGLAHGLAVFSYPPLLLPALAFLSTLALMQRDARLRTVATYGLPALVPITVLGLIVVNAGIQNVRSVYASAQRFGERPEGGGVEKVGAVISDVAHLAVHSPLVIAAILTLATCLRFRPAIAFWIAASLPLLVFLRVGARHVSDSLEYVTVYGLSALPLFFFVGRTQPERTVFLVAWPAAFVGGLATAWASANGRISFGLGFAAAPIVTTLLLACLCDRGRRFVALFAGTTVVAALLIMQFGYVYRDGAFSSLGSPIGSGPFAGIHTTSERKRFVEMLTRDLRTLSPSTCEILFYDEFPAGYLLASSRPETNAVFELIVPRAQRVGYRSVLLRYYKAQSRLPDVIVRMTSVPGIALTMPLTRSDPLDRLVAESGAYILTEKRRRYAIYTHRTAGCREAPEHATRPA